MDIKSESRDVFKYSYKSDVLYRALQHNVAFSKNKLPYSYSEPMHVARIFSVGEEGFLFRGNIYLFIYYWGRKNSYSEPQVHSDLKRALIT